MCSGRDGHIVRAAHAGELDAGVVHADAKRVRREVIPRLLAIYGHIPLPDKYLPEGYERPPAPEPPNLKM